LEIPFLEDVIRRMVEAPSFECPGGIAPGGAPRPPSPPGNPAINGQTINQKRGGTMNKTDDQVALEARLLLLRMDKKASSGASARAKVQRP
jgi:hypothetical protein